MQLTSWAASLALLLAPPQPVAAVRFGATSGDVWSTLLEGFRKDQADLENEAENWVPQAVQFTEAWTKELNKLYTGVTGSIMKEKTLLKQIATQKATLCPASCQMDAMKNADFSVSKEARDLKAQKTTTQGKLAELMAQKSEVETLKDRVASYIAAANKLKYKASAELERFNNALATKVEPRTKKALLITMGKTIKRPTMADLKKPLEMEVKRLADEKKHCESLKGFEGQAKAYREKMTSDHDQEMSRLRGRVEKYNNRQTKADDKTDAFSQVTDGFATICQKEKDGYKDMIESKLDGLEPKEVKQLFEAEVDEHHQWWKSTCSNMKSLAGGITGWMANCKQNWQKSVLSAEENILDMENKPARQSLDGLTKTVSDMCDKDFAKKQAELDAKLKDVTDFCEAKTDGKKNCGTD